VWVLGTARPYSTAHLALMGMGAPALYIQY
jgi:hypothetical protein